ncbi:NADPH:quinone oxidoreductase family protein [Phenylobacterium sp.]|uniref:NADPH:quinone oxidoreductase family protein n=1 Tax=Phenylobacterium sp. TaxID=1871053 RepID=UPI00286E5D15|nr:NADPH:quinone oxidoreductase family protein [Phenylobacterium sp.]
MRALVVEELAADYGGCVLKEIETPEPRPGEVRIKVRAAAVNFPDLLQTRGEYQHKPALPFIPGMEIAGEVEALGEGVTQFQIGDAVVGGARVGGFSQYAVTPAAILRPKPANLSFSQAAGYATAYLTAYVSLVRRAQVEAGEWVLVHGAAGGVGLAAVDLARHLGCKVIAASASDEKLAIIEKEYAPEATVNVTGGFRERVKEITGGRGADVIYDPVGGDVFDESVRCVAFNGRILSIGFTSGRLPVLPVNMALIKGFSVMGVRAGEYGRQFPEKGRENTADIWALANEGKMHPRVDHEYPLSEWRAAFESLANRKVVGKTIVRPDL